MKKETKKLIVIIWQILLTLMGAAFLWMQADLIKHPLLTQLSGISIIATISVSAFVISTLIED